MCGFLVLAMEKYADGLNVKGYSIAVCRQKQNEDGDVIREVDFIKEPINNINPKQYKAEWDEYMRNFDEDSLKLESDLRKKDKASKRKGDYVSSLLKELEELDMETLTPIEAFHFLERWKKK